MTNEEAIKELNEMKDFALDHGSYWGETAIDLYDTAIDALEKQIPKKPFETYDDDTCIYKHFECPNCGSHQSRHASLVYCMDCGQAIDWSDDDDK